MALTGTPPPDYEETVGGSFGTPLALYQDYKDWTALLLALFPTGRAWNKELRWIGPMPDNTFHAYLATLAGELSRLDIRTNDFLEEIDPRTAIETLDDWERIVGLPDECATEVPGTPQERQDLVVSRLNNRGGQSIAFFYDLASIWGYTIGTGTYDRYLLYDNEASGPFEVEEQITGGVSLIVADIDHIVDWGTTGALALRGATGAFQDDEQITGGDSGATADVNGTLGGVLLEYDNEAGGPFTVGEIITGASSLNTGTIRGVQDDGLTGKLVIEDPTGPFEDGEEIEGGTSNATADVDGDPIEAPGIDFQILEFVPALAGRSGAGDPCGSEIAWFYWQVKGTNLLAMYFRAGTPCGNPIRWWTGGDVLTCYLDLFKPAHTMAIYSDKAL